MRTLLLPIGLAALCLSRSVAQAQPGATPLSPVPRLTFEQAQDRAATRSVERAAARREVEAADGGVQQAGARPNRELNTSVEATRTTTTTLEFPLALGGKCAARVDAAERARDLPRAQLAQAKAALRADVVASYFATVIAQERVRLAGDSADLGARAAEVVGRRVAAGKTSPIDATRAQVDAANAGLELEDARAELHSARLALATTWGATTPHFEAVEGDIDSTPSAALAAELLQAVEESPALVSGRIEIERRQAIVGVERSRAVPDLVLSAGVLRDNQPGRTQAVIGVSIPLPLFDRNQGAVHEAARRAEQARDELAQARIRLIAETDEAATRLTAQASLRTLRTTVLPAARQTCDAATTGFEAGKFGFLDVIDAQRALLQARARYLNTLSYAWQAATDIARLLGR
jgi:cobalt-zinc-cadmium efflux system outer membrane protein